MCNKLRKSNGRVTQKKEEKDQLIRFKISERQRWNGKLKEISADVQIQGYWPNVIHVCVLYQFFLTLSHQMQNTIMKAYCVYSAIFDKNSKSDSLV